jgi:hypothetical protein
MRNERSFHLSPKFYAGQVNFNFIVWLKRKIVITTGLLMLKTLTCYFLGDLGDKVAKSSSGETEPLRSLSSLFRTVTAV